MTSTFAPYISFPGNATEAFTFYQSVFGGELTLMHYEEQLAAGAEFPFTPPPGVVAHGTLEGGYITLAGGDDVAENPEPFNRGSLSFLVSPATVEEAERLIEGVTADGGQVTMPFLQAPWGDHYGQCEDKFGMTWQFAVSPAA